jgi:signal transduction histidine kinase
LEVEDEGVGFQKVEPQGMGLVSMRERAELVNGRLDLLSGEGGGALIRLTAPTTEDSHA